MSGTKIALVTGANKGIGLETARQLAARGITVLLGARDAGRGQAAADALKGEGLDVTFVPLDVADPATVREAAARVGETYGRLDILVNNAGVYTDAGVSASQATEEQWRQALDANVTGLALTTQAFLPLLKQSEAGRIVNLSSILGSIAYAADPNSPTGSGAGNGAVYAVTKAAVNMYTVHLAAELRDTNIKVNAAHPGWVKTDMGGEQAPMELEDGAKTSVLLATLPADGPTGGYFHLNDALPW
jgi:NAD(P)-dependent dehydrogenase (short-subunit alcohol dehydrogenase family)